MRDLLGEIPRHPVKRGRSWECCCQQFEQDKIILCSRCGYGLTFPKIKHTGSLPFIGRGKSRPRMTKDWSGWGDEVRGVYRYWLGLVKPFCETELVAANWAHTLATEYERTGDFSSVIRLANEMKGTAEIKRSYVAKR